jgi:glycosyltransferase involved in cell wall biosynthesis
VPADVVVAICIATYQRPDGLDRLLAGIAAQELSDPAPHMRVVVVDNDAAGTTSQAVIDRWRPRLPELILEREPRQGISFARNRALDAAGEPDFVAFIDDDEVPAVDWLEQLLRVQRAYGADVVRGPVIPHFANQPEPWILAGGFFDRPRHPTGTEVEIAYTHNTLLRWNPYGRDLRFSPRYARSGGSDTHFFTLARRRGARIVWCDEAVVAEWNPPARQTVKWLAKRQYRIGLVRSALDAELHLVEAPRLRSARVAYRRMLRGALLLGRNARGPRHEQVDAILWFASGLGRLAGLLGFWFEEYRSGPSA